MGLVKKIFTGLVLLLTAQSVVSQEMLGITASNYGGSNGLLINPGSILGSKLYMDVNILTGDIFVENNYLYIHGEDYTPMRYLQKDAEFPEYGPKKQAFDHYFDKNLKYAYTQLRFVGPSGFVVYNDHAFALQTQVRNIVSLDKIPYDVANFAYEGLDYPPQFNINYVNNDFSIAAMSWGEIDLSYAYTVYKYSHDRVNLGVTLKYLMGYSGVYVDGRQLDYLMLNDSTADIRNLDASVGFSGPVNYDNEDFPYGSTFKGSGFGIDLGVTYIRTKRGHSNRRYNRLCERPYEDYYYKIGVSLLDFGGIKFKDNAQLHEFDNVSHYWERIDTLSFTSINDLVHQFSSRFYSNPNASLANNQFTVGLPTAFSFQFDYHYFNQWYLGGMFIYPLNLNNNSIVRPAQAVLIPRYETREFEVSMPVSLYRLERLRVGFSARYRSFTVGTDKLGSLFGFSDFTGTDIYFSVKLNFGKGFCSHKKVDGCQNNEYSKYRRR